MALEKYQWHFISRIAAPKRAASDRIQDFQEIYFLPSESAVREQASRCVQCPASACRSGCPLNNRIPEWISLAAEGKFLEAAEISHSTSNIPEICSRVCPQERLCEGACVLNVRSEPVAIGLIEKYINERYLAAQPKTVFPQASSINKQVAIIGAGPAGICCADELAKQGYSVTIFESLDQAGGLLVFGIPAFKLDKNVVARRIELLKQRGVEFRCDITVGQDVSLNELRQKFDAIFLGGGAQFPKRVDVPGSDLKGIFDALPFLIQKNIGPSRKFPAIDVSHKRVIVLGGGDTAMDCLRTAIRSGARQAVCLYRRDEANMPGNRREFANAIEEGSKFEFLVNPVEIRGDMNGCVKTIRCIRMELGEVDRSGRRNPVPVKGSEFDVETDIIIVAYGFDPVPYPDSSGMNEIARDRYGCLVVDKNQMTNIPGIFSGGDQVRGPSLVVHAVRDGRKAAAGIHHYLMG